MKTYLLPLFALLIVGCGNRKQVSTTTEDVGESISSPIEQLDSIKKIPPVIVARIRAEITDKLWPKDEPADNHEIDLWQAVNGDFNGDGKIDTAYLYRAQTSANRKLEYCEQEWFNGIAFSDISISSFSPERAPQFNYGLLTNEEDIDGDGADEIGFFTRAFSRFGMYRVYSFRKEEWKEIVSVYTHDNFYGEENGNEPDLVRIDPDRKGYAIIRTLEWDDEISWHKEIEKSVKIK